jgi:uncharacterized protein
MTNSPARSTLGASPNTSSPPRWLTVLSSDECRSLLAGAFLGRVGVSVNALPVILPVVYRVESNTVWFFTEVGTKLHAAANNAVVAFEVDSLDEHQGWSVLVIGQSFLCTDSATVTQLRIAGLKALAPGVRSDLVGIPIQHISGRRFTFTQESIDGAGYL